MSIYSSVILQKLQVITMMITDVILERGYICKAIKFCLGFTWGSISIYRVSLSWWMVEMKPLFRYNLLWVEGWDEFSCAECLCYLILLWLHGVQVGEYFDNCTSLSCSANISVSVGRCNSIDVLAEFWTLIPGEWSWSSL